MTESDRELRDLLARAEQDIKNHKETFYNFKNDDFSALKAEVHQMRKELNDKIEIIEKVSSINLTMAKWAGGLTVLVFFADMLVKRFFGG